MNATELHRSVSATVVVSPDVYELRRERLRWLAQLRWWALVGALTGAIVAAAADWRFVSAPGIAAGVAVGVFVNGWLWWRTRTGGVFGPNELSLHVVADLLALSWLLTWSGGIKNPMGVIFSFHVVLGALLAGRRGALLATVGALTCMVMLFGLEYAGVLPTTPVTRAPEALWVIALGLLICGLSYFSLVLAERLRQERAVAVRQQEEAVSNLHLFLGALDALKVGLEIVGSEGDIGVQNAFAKRIRALPPSGDHTSSAAVAVASSAQGTQNTRFAVRDVDGGQRIIDRLTVSPSADAPIGAFLYVDRTEQLLVEQRHILLERLATLGRALQGVAHELNTPLMTMQTLAKDVIVALGEASLPASLSKDVGESLDLIVEESRRCKGLTQGLLSTAREGGSASRGLVIQSLLPIAKRAVQLVGASQGPGDVVLDEQSLDVSVRCDGDRVLQILMNLIQNALQAVEESAGDAPKVTVVGVSSDSAFTVQIEDRGVGLPAAVRARLFEPFVTTRAQGEGTGLGLYVSLMIAQELGAELRLDDRPEGGTLATLTFPR